MYETGDLYQESVCVNNYDISEDFSTSSVLVCFRGPFNTALD